MTVTIEIPASEPTLRKPEGDAGGCDQLAQTLYAVSGRYEQMADEATRLQEVRSFHGDAYDAYRTASGKASGEHAAMATTVERVGRAVTSYADNLREHLVAHDDLVERKAALDRQRADLVRDVNTAGEVTPAEIDALRERARWLRGDYAALVTDHEALQRRVRDNEDLLRQSFVSGTRLQDALSETGGTTQEARDAMSQPGAPGTGATPEQVRDWWEGLTDAEREAVIASYPGLVGSADGLPAAVRDEANRIVLDDDLATLGAQDDDGTLSDLERKMLENAQKTQQALADADAFEDPLDGHRPGGTLYLYDPSAFDGDGAVAVGVGDLDTADDVAIFTPGISTDMQDVTGYTDQMQNLYESTRFNGDGSSVATMFWLGYDAPQGPTDTATLTEGRADDGGERLADTIAGMQASRADDPAHLTAIGHSYGSTTTSYALGEHGARPDDVVLIGSPGAGPASEAGELNIGEDHVYVGRDSRDLVATLGDEGWIGKGGLGLGTDPSSEDFGATRFEAENVNRSWHINTGDAHSNYLQHDTESLYNIGRVVDGHGDQVNVADQSYDPWYSGPVDPEWDRDPSTGVEGESRTQE